MALKLVLFPVFILFCLGVAAQDTLPNFSAINRGKGRIIISWTNIYGRNIKQLSIQRSFDSLRNFKSILTLPDPTVPQNGYVDNNAINDHMFYRLYILLDGGKYLFSPAQRPILFPPATGTYIPQKTEPKGIITLDKLEKDSIIENKIERIIFVKKRDTLVGGIPESSLKRFRDSINFTTRDTIFMKTSDTLVVKTFIPKEFYRPSKYVFTEKDGNIKIALPDAGLRKYAIKFFETDQSEAFEIKHISDTLIILDKTNFVHSGWFNFELYEDGKLKEKHRLYVPKDF